MHMPLLEQSFLKQGSVGGSGGRGASFEEQLSPNHYFILIKKKEN